MLRVEKIIFNISTFVINSYPRLPTTSTYWYPVFCSLFTVERKVGPLNPRYPLSQLSVNYCQSDVQLLPSSSPIFSGSGWVEGLNLGASAEMWKSTLNSIWRQANSNVKFYNVDQNNNENSHFLTPTVDAINQFIHDDHLTILSSMRWVQRDAIIQVYSWYSSHHGHPSLTAILKFRDQ